MNDDSILGSALGQVGSVVKQTGKQIIKAPREVVEGVVKQLGGEDQKVSEEKSLEQKKQSSEDQTKEVVKSFYAKSDPSKSNLEKEDSEFEKQIADKTPEEQKKLLELRQQLHAQYYQQLTNPPKQPEERPAEKVEKEKKMEALDIEQKEKEKPPPLVQRATQRVEKFPGAAG